MKIPSMIMLFLFGVAIAQTIHFYPLMPELVGSHFDATGKVNQVLPKLGYFIVYLVTLVVGSSFTIFLPWLLKYLPVSLINLPHRDYWLSGEEREASLHFLSNHFGWFGVATTLLIVVIFHLTFLANVGSPKDINSPVFWALLGGYFVYVGVWTFQLVKRFPQPM